MAAKHAPRPMALCELCFLDDHTRWEPESMDEQGRVLMKLIGVDVPEKLNTETVETCCMCGGITVAGIFMMVSPDDVHFLEEDELDNQFEMSLESSLDSGEEDF